MNDLEAKVEQLTIELKTAKEALAAYNGLNEEERLAIYLHQHLCTHNHTDGCSWHYEIKGQIHDFLSDTHARYLVKARQLLEIGPDYQIKKIVRIVSLWV